MAQKLFFTAREQLTFLTKEASEALTKHRFVKQNGSDAGKCDMADTAGEAVLGVVTQDWDSGDYAEIQFDRIALVEAGAAITVLEQVQTDTSGRAITAAAADHICGTALVAATAAGEIIPVYLSALDYIVHA